MKIYRDLVMNNLYLRNIDVTIAIMLKLCHMRLAQPHCSVRNLILNHPTSSRTAIEIPR